MFETPWLHGQSPLVLSRKHRWLLSFTLNVLGVTWKQIRGEETRPVCWPLLITAAASLTGWCIKPFSNFYFCDSWQAHKRRVFEEEFQGRWENARHSEEIRRIKKSLKKKDTWEIGQILPLQGKLSLFAIWTSSWQQINQNISFNIITIKKTFTSCNLIKYLLTEKHV